MFYKKMRFYKKMEMFKENITYWSINQNTNLLKKINLFIITISWIPVLGFLTYLLIFVSKFTKLNKRIFSPINYTWRIFWKTLFLCFSYSTYLSIFIFMFLYFFIFNFFDVDKFLLITSCTATSLFLFWISHLTFVACSLICLNLRIEGTLNKRLFFILKNSTVNHNNFLNEENRNFLIDISNTKYFLERFKKDFFKDLKDPTPLWETSRRNKPTKIILDIQASYFKRSKKYKGNILKYFYFVMRQKIENDSESKYLYRNYFSNFTSEFNTTNSVFKSLFASKVYFRQLNHFYFKKYFYLYLFFVFLEIFVLMPIEVIFIFFDKSYARYNVLGLSELIWTFSIFLTCAIFGLIWKLSLKNWCKYTDLYALKASNEKLLKLMGNEKKLNKHNHKISIFFLRIFEQDKTKITANENNVFLCEKEKEIKKEFFKILKSLNRFKKLMKPINIYCEFTFSIKATLSMCYLVLVIGLEYFGKAQWEDSWFVYIFIFFVLIFCFFSFVTFFTIHIYLLVIKYKIQSINIKYGTKFMYPYLTNFYKLPSFFFIIPLKTHHINPLNCFNSHQFHGVFQINFWNTEFKRGTSFEYDSRTFDSFFEEFEKANDFLKTFGLKEFLNKESQEILFSSEFNLLERVLKGLEEYQV